ncbi:MAG: hypothetical protein ACI9U2_002855 [Bradymonadia bacterium]|jgi:hypothetical protein
MIARTPLMPLLVALLVSAPALAAPTIVAPPLKPGAGVPVAIGAQFDISLRKALAAKATLLGAAQTSAGLRGAGASSTDICDTDACGAKLAAKTKSRFVVSAKVASADEIYNVSLSIFDASRKERLVVNGVCELCTAGEVNGTIATAVGRLDKALSKPEKAPEPVKPKTQTLDIKSRPAGAQIFVDGKKMGVSPKAIALVPGQHAVELRKAGFVTVRNTIIISDRPTAYAPLLKAVPPAVVAAPVTAAAIVAPPVVVTPIVTPPVVTAPVGRRGIQPAGHYNGAAWGMMVGGAALAGVGTWLIVLDGEVTCDDGRGRATCPNVYNTKGVGIAGLGIGAALIGASIAVFAVGPTDEPDAPAAGFDMLPEGGGMVRFGGQF